MNRNKNSGVATALILIGGGCLLAWNIPLGLFVGLVWLLPIIVAIDLGITRDRTGWMWGLFLGWIGVLILAIMRPQPRPVVLLDRRDALD